MAGIFIYGGNAGHLSGQYLESILRRDRCAGGQRLQRLREMDRPPLEWRTTVSLPAKLDTALAVGADVSPKGFLTAKSDNAVQDRDVIRWKMGGMPNPIYWALECTKRMQKYGTKEEDLALVKVLMSEFGSKNPDARV